MTVEFAYGCLYIGVLIVLAALIGLMVVRAIIGPRITDRILSINVLGTLVISAIAVLSRYLDEGYLLDVALIYTMISFVSVLIMASVYIPARPFRGPVGAAAMSSPEEDKKTPENKKRKKTGRKRR